MGFLKEHYEWLKRKGIVQIHINIVRHPEDQEFDPENPPVGGIITYSGKTDTDVKRTMQYHGMVPADHPIEIELKSMIESAKKVSSFNSELAGSIVTIGIIPDQGWDNNYKSIVVERVYKSGGTYTENLAFERESTSSNNSPMNKPNERRIISRRKKNST